ncbi:MAG: restriction endonuclease subunit S [Candidatus Delongbacteria bacterium]|jgi:type I restriction enzyme S subunit|nr:restriction endonuclease subunit S [Candidatus Delongbacteria bacterium]
MAWEVRKLGDVCEILDNKRKPITKRDRIEGEYPYYGATGILSYVDEYIFDEKLVLIGEDGAKWESGDNTSFIVEGKYWVNNHAHVIRPNRKIVLDEWIVNYLNFSDLRVYVTGLTVPKLNQEKMKSIEIPIPPLAEQKRIVAKLDEAFSAILTAKENAEKNLKNAKELFESYLNNIFEEKGKDWEEKKLGEVAEIKNGYSFTSKEFSSKNELKSVKITNVGVKEFIIDTENNVPSKYKTGYENYQVKVGEIVIALTRTIISAGLKVAIVPKDYDAALINQRVSAISSTKYTSNMFLYNYLCTEHVLKYVKKKVNTLMQPNLSVNDLRNTPIPLPPLKEQQRIVSKLDALSEQTKKLEAVYAKKIADLDELKKSILQKAFRGEL